MFNKTGNIFYSLATFTLLFFLVSCKSKKNAQITGEKLLETTAQKAEAYNQVKFDAMYVDGCAARMKGNLDDAKKLFTECRKIKPENNAVNYELATVYKLLGVNDQALLFAKACAAAEPKNEWYQLLLVACFDVQKQYYQSIRVRETLVKNFPLRSEFKEDLAIEYALTGQYEKAFKIYDELEKVFGTNEQITLNKVKLLKNQKKFKEAEAELLRLSASNPKETKYYSFLAEFYIEQSNPAKAKEMYDKIIAIEPNNPMVNLALHDYYSAQGNMTEAFEYLTRAFENPDLDVYTKSSIVNSFIERIDGKESDYYREKGNILAKILVQVHPQSPESNAIYGRFLAIDNKPELAADYYYRAAIKEKGNFQVWSDLLRVYNNLGKYDSLEHVSAMAIDRFPNSADLYFYNGYANIQLRNYKKAVISLKDGLEFEDNKQRMINFYLNLGDAYNAEKEYEKSDKAFDDVLKIDSDNTFALNQYAYYLSLRKENLEKAEKLAKRANDLLPENRKYMDTYGWILYQERKYRDAELWLGGAAKLGPKDQTILEHYGDVLFRLNKTNEALKFWEDAKAAGGNSELLLKKIKEKKLND